MEDQRRVTAPDPLDPAAVEAAAIALAEDCTKLWLGGNHAPAWEEVSEDVREEWRRQVRIVMQSYRLPNGVLLPPSQDGKFPGRLGID